MNVLTPTSAACADLRRYMARDVTVSSTRLLLGLSAVSTGLEQIEGGRVADGVVSVRRGLEFLRVIAEGK